MLIAVTLPVVLSLLNLVVFAFSPVLAEMFLGLAIAVALREPFRGRGMLRAALLLPWLLSPSASGVMWHNVLNQQSGLLNYITNLFRLPPLPYALGLETSYWT